MMKITLLFVASALAIVHLSKAHPGIFEKRDCDIPVHFEFDYNSELLLPLGDRFGKRVLSERLLSHIQRLEAAIRGKSEENVKPYQAKSTTTDTSRTRNLSGEIEEPFSRLAQLFSSDTSSDVDAADYNKSDFESESGFYLTPERLENLRRLRGNLRKRNYNLDHLARMNFRRSYRASSLLNNRHIFGGLKK